MIKSSVCVAFLFIFSGSSGKLLGGGLDEHEYDVFWEKMSITWCEAPYNSSSSCFEEMPMTVYEAVSKGWNYISGDDCTNNGKYNGFRYIYQSDYSVALIYDATGFICGIQTHMRASELTSCKSSFFYNFEKVPSFILTRYEGHDYFSRTVYFVNPNTICTKGRYLKQYYEEGFADGIWLQIGPTPLYTEYVPKFRPEAAMRHWENAQCVNAMGFHNFQYLSKWDIDHCATATPFYMLYDENDNMIGMSFLTFGNATSENQRYEHRPANKVKTVMNGKFAPKCVYPFITQCGFTTMHVWFTHDPKSFRCPPGQGV